VGLNGGFFINYWRNNNMARISQTDVPAYSLEHALRVSVAIAENYASKPTKPLDVAAAMNLTPSSSSFKMLTGASIAYGLTEGGYNAGEIQITSLGKKILRPLEEGQDIEGKKEALLKPRIINEFLTQYDGSPIPKDSIAQNVLVEKGVPEDRTSNVLALILEGAESLGLIQEIKGKKYVNLSRKTSTTEHQPLQTFTAPPDESSDLSQQFSTINSTLTYEQAPTREEKPSSRRVFITHGKNKDFVEPIKKLLSFGELDAVVSVEKQSVSQPVPEKVMNDMRSCSAAIIHVEGELKLLAQDATEHIVLNPNVLIEIGAAMALYGKRFILLVKDGVKLPSNLQGLYEVRYTGEALDGNATIKLLEAINELKKQPVL
jgi:predicted nucleotide-binding protein